MKGDGGDREVSCQEVNNLFQGLRHHLDHHPISFRRFIRLHSDQYFLLDQLLNEINEWEKAFDRAMRSVQKTGPQPVIDIMQDRRVK